MIIDQIMITKNIKTGFDLRSFRVSLGLTQSEFAQAIGYRLNRISVVERNDFEVHYKMINAIEKYSENLKRRSNGKRKLK